MFSLSIRVLLLLSSISTFADLVPVPTKQDPRIKTITYNADDIVTVTAHYYYSTIIIFSDKEVISNVAVGDSKAWQIEQTANKIFIKPIDDQPDTNMTVITNLRIYYFALVGSKAERKSPSHTFALRFFYPEDDRLLLQRTADSLALMESKELYQGNGVAPEKMNFNYTYKGDDRLRPKHVFDDGAFTYFAFDPQIATPAIFLVDPSSNNPNNEKLVNFHTRGSYIVVERVGEQFTLRQGRHVTCVFNQTILTM